jgi:hypothetical protein
LGVRGPYVTVLKRDYTSPAFYVLDAQTGAVKWMKKGQEAIFSARLDAQAGELYGIGAPDMQKPEWTLRCLDAETGTEKRRMAGADWKVFPETQILEADGEGKLAVRILPGAGKGALWLVDGKKMETLKMLAIEGDSPFGEIGGKSCVSQNGYSAALCPGKLTANRKGEGKAP